MQHLADALEDAIIGDADPAWVQARCSALARLARPPEALPPELAGEIAALLQRAAWPDHDAVTALLRRAAATPARVAEALALATDTEATGHLIWVRVLLVPGGVGASTAQRWAPAVAESVERAIRAGLQSDERHFHARWEIRAAQGRPIRTLEGSSAGLAAAVATRAALEARTLPAWGFTGDVALDGQLRAVGAVPVKLRLAATAGLSAVALPAENLPIAADLEGALAAAGVTPRPVQSLRQLWRALGWAPAPSGLRRRWLRPAGALATGGLALALLAGLHGVLRAGTLELCLLPLPARVGAALTLQARSSRRGQALAYLISAAGRVTQVSPGATPVALGAASQILVAPRGPLGEQLVLEAGDEAMVVLWSADTLPSPGAALRLVRAPLGGAEGDPAPPVLSLELTPRGACWAAPLPGAGAVGAYRLPLWETP